MNSRRANASTPTAASLRTPVALVSSALILAVALPAAAGGISHTGPGHDGADASPSQAASPRLRTAPQSSASAAPPATPPPPPGSAAPSASAAPAATAAPPSPLPAQQPGDTGNVPAPSTGSRRTARSSSHPDARNAAKRNNRGSRASHPAATDQPYPTDYDVDDSGHSGAETAGAVMVILPYGIGLAVGAGSSFTNQTGWLTLPVAGPFITLASRHSSCANPPPGEFDFSGMAPCVADGYAAFALVVDGLVQSVGALLFISGTASDHTRDDTESHVVVTPTRVGSGYGLGIAGRL